MSAKPFLISLTLALVLLTTGCRSFCERHYPCPAPAPAPTTACVPCVPCVPTASYSAPAPAATWNSPAPRNCRWVCD